MNKVVFDFSDCKYIVTGATSGMGKEVALELAAAGAIVLAVGRNAIALKELQEKFPTNIFPAQVDVCDSNALEEAISIFVSEHGKLNGAVHAAGISEITPIKSYDEDTARRYHVVNGFRSVEGGQDLPPAHSRLLVPAVWYVPVYR